MLCYVQSIGASYKKTNRIVMYLNGVGWFGTRIYNKKRPLLRLLHFIINNEYKHHKHNRTVKNYYAVTHFVELFAGE